jgi:DNA-binding SARP family transcriptional activator
VEDTVEDLEIRLLGELQVLRGGMALPLPASKKTRALLGYLAATGRPHLRETLCELLWPGPDDPRAALRWSLTKIRTLLDEPATTRIIADRERVALEPAKATVDLTLARSATTGSVTEIDTPTLRAIAARFRGELLEGLEMPDAYRFQEWLAGQREGARALRLKVLGTIIDRVRGDPEGALPYARERVGIDTLSEAAHVTVIELLAELGRKREALAQFDACVRILSTELHAKPGPGLLAARMGLVHRGSTPAASLPPPTTPAISPPPLVPSAAAPLVGRVREWAATLGHLDAAAKGTEARVLLFAGEPGIGKSHLLDALASAGQARGAQVLRGRAYEAEMVRPYGGWIDALRSTSLGELDDALRADLGPLLPELGGAAAAVDRGRLFDAVSRLLARLSACTPAIVILDDIQWFDDASAALLHSAARAPSSSRIVFACGARSEELADNPAALRLVRALSREARLDRFDLAPLDAAATVAIAAALDPRVDPARVLRESAGNPLFAMEVTRALSRGDEALADSLDGLIADRLAYLDDGARDLVPWAAAIGRTFGPEVLASVTGLGASALVNALAELERRGIVRASPSGEGYDFVHDLIRAGAYRRLSAPRRRLVHMEIARSLAARAPGDGSLAGEVAHHAALGGDRDLAARFSLDAAERALRLFAGAEAGRLASAGLEHAATLPRDARLPLQLALLRVKVVSTPWRGERQTLGADLSRIITEAQDAGLHAAASNGLQALSVLQREAGDLDGAHESTLRAVDVVRQAEPMAKARQMSDSARCLATLEREMVRAEGMLSEARAIFGEAARDSLQFAWGLGLLQRFRGNMAESKELVEHAMRLAHRSEDHWAECEGLMTLVEIELDLGRPLHALSRCGELQRVAAKMGEGSEGPAAEALEALARVASGEREAERLDRALGLLREIDAKGMLAYVLTHAARLDLEAGRTAEARRRAHEALRAAEAVDRRTQVALARVVLGKTALAEGDSVTAARHCDALRADVAEPLRLSAHARAGAFALADALGTHLAGERPCLT